MAKISGMQSIFSITEAFEDLQDQIGEAAFDAVDDLTDDINEIVNNGTLFDDFYDTEYDASISGNSVTLSLKAERFDNEDSDAPSETINEKLVFSGKNFAAENETTEVNKLTFSGKETYNFTDFSNDDDFSFESEESGSSSFNGNATFSYRPFSEAPLKLFTVNDRESYSYKSVSRSNDGPRETWQGKGSYSIALKADLTVQEGLSGKIFSATYADKESGNSSIEGESEKSSFSYDRQGSFNSRDGITLGAEEVVTGTIDSLKLSSKYESSGFMDRQKGSFSENFQYDGANIDAGIFSAGSIRELAELLLAGDDQISGTSGNDQILGIGGADSYTWDLRKDGSDQVNLSRSIDELGSEEQAFAQLAAAPSNSEEMDTVTISGAKGKEQIRVTFVSAEIGNGNSRDDENGNNEDGGLAVRIQLEDATGTPAGNTGRFDDEGMMFKAKSGTFDVRDLNSGAARGDQFKTVHLGTQAGDSLNGGSTADYLNAGAGNDTIASGNGDDFLVGGAGNDTLIGGKGKDTFIGGGGNDTFVFAKSDSSLKFKTVKITENGNTSTEKVLQADTINDFVSGIDTLRFDGIKLGGQDSFLKAEAAVSDYAAALLAAGEAIKDNGKTADKSALFSFQFTESNGYLFQDYTGDGKVDQVIVLVGINNTEINAADLGIAVPV